MSDASTKVDEKKSAPTGFYQRAREAAKVMAVTPRVLRLVWNAHPWYTFCVVFLNLVLGMVPLAETWIFKLIIDALAAAVRTPATSAGAFVSLIPILAAMALIRLFSNCTEPTTRLVQQQLGDYLSRDISKMILTKANSLVDIGVFEDPKFHDDLQKAQNEARYRPMQILSNATNILRATMSLVSMTVVLVAFQPILTLAVLLLSLPHLVVQFQHQRESWAIHDWEVPEVRKMHYFSSVLTSRYDAKEIRMFGLGEYFFGRYMDKFNAFHERHSKLRSTQWRTNVILAAVAAAGIAGAYAYVLYCALGGYISLGSLTLYLTAASQVENSLQSIIWSASMMYEGNLFANDLFKFTDLKPSMVVAPPELAHKLDGKLKEGIEFRDVAFKYPDNERSVLKGLSFTLKKGQTIALVGENGAGKTTIVKLLSRLYDPSEGQIFIDGVDLREYDVEDWRGHMAVVFQDFSHYHMTAKENIGVGKVKNMADLEAVRLAAEQGGALTVVERLDHGFETLLGRWYGGEDGGADLSGGEWQKIALARAFMRSSAKTGSGDGNGHSGGAPVPLLILDEPTAALDAKAEYEVYMRFHELTAGKTTILISHRFSTVRMADHILVLDGGQIIESGNHEELMAKGAEYARMYNLQADRYR